MKSKRKIAILILALVVIFGSVSVASAYTSAATVSVGRTSNTSARASADITYSTVVSSCTTKMTLQEKYGGSWRTATGVPVKTVSKTRTSVSSMGFPYTFTLKKGVVYRIKAVFSSKKGTSSTTKTLYSPAF